MKELIRILSSDTAYALILFGGGLSFLLALVQLLQPHRSVKNVLLFCIFLSLTVIQLQQYAVIGIVADYRSAGEMVLLMAKYLLGPSMYLFYQITFNKDYHFTVKSTIHFIPFLIALFLVLLPVMGSVWEIGLIQGMNSIIVKHGMLPLAHSLGMAVILGYIVAILSQLEILSVIRDHKRSRISVIAIMVTVTLFIITVLLIISMAYNLMQFSLMALALTSFFVISWFIMGQVYPDLFIPAEQKSRKRRHRNIELKGIDEDELRKRLISLMEEDKIYCDEDLSLKRLAGLLDMQPHNLSLFLNVTMQANFNVFVNRYRIEEALQIMKVEPERSLLSIAFAVGFNSKSSFYEAFKKQTGVSPARYRKTMEISPQRD